MKRSQETPAANARSFDELSPEEQAQASVIVASEVVAMIRSGEIQGNGTTIIELDGIPAEVPYGFVIGEQLNKEGE
jgi:hypothetical protein